MSDPRQREPEYDPSDGDSVDAVTRQRAGQYLVVRLNGREYALPANAVRGMVELRGAAPGTLCAGADGQRAAIIQGRSLPVIPVHQLLGLRERPITARSCLVLIAHPVEELQPRFAFVADSISRVERIQLRNWRGEPGEDWMAAQIRLGEKWRGVLDLDRLATARGLRAA